MFNQKDHYIRLVEGRGVKTKSGEAEVVPQSRVVQLGGDHWGWVWNQPSGIIVRREGEEEHLRIYNLTHLVTALLYGISAILFIMGFFKVFERKTEA